MSDIPNPPEPKTRAAAVDILRDKLRAVVDAEAQLYKSPTRPTEKTIIPLRLVYDELNQLMEPVTRKIVDSLHAAEGKETPAALPNCTPLLEVLSAEFQWLALSQYTLRVQKLIQDAEKPPARSIADLLKKLGGGGSKITMTELAPGQSPESIIDMLKEDAAKEGIDLKITKIDLGGQQIADLLTPPDNPLGDPMGDMKKKKRGE